MLTDIGCFYTGLAGGLLVAGGVFAFITAIGVISRLIARTNTARFTWIYEDMVVLGGGLGNVISVMRLQISAGDILLSIAAVFAGIFTGCIAMALAEVIQIIPITISRIKLKTGLAYIVVSFSVGKLLGSLYQLLNS